MIAGYLGTSRGARDVRGQPRTQAIRGWPGSAVGPEQGASDWDLISKDTAAAMEFRLLVAG